MFSAIYDPVKKQDTIVKDKLGQSVHGVLNSSSLLCLFFFSYSFLGDDGQDNEDKFPRIIKPVDRFSPIVSRNGVQGC